MECCAATHFIYLYLYLSTHKAKQCNTSQRTVTPINASGMRSACHWVIESLYGWIVLPAAEQFLGVGLNRHTMMQ